MSSNKMFDTNKQQLPINPNQKGQTLCESNKSTNALKENKNKAGGDPGRRRAKAKKQKALDRQYYEGDNE